MVLPDCSGVWVAGRKLDERYDGCATMQSMDLAVVIDCADGSRLTTYQDRYWAVLGGRIKDSGSNGGISDDPGYSDDYQACTSGS